VHVLKGYADHHVVFPLVAALRRRGMEVVTAIERGQQQANDSELLALALAEQRVMLTNDTDFLILAAKMSSQGETFAPIFFWPQQKRKIGPMMRCIIREASRHEYEAILSQVFFL
jgi:hypothetical protein